MWKKNESDQPEMTPPVTSVRPQPVREQAIIGSSLVVKGDVSGDEDLLIQGNVEGKVVLRNNSITVGKNGQVKADLFGKTISIEGTVHGNLFGDERIVIRQSGTVHGNLQAPRVTLEEGAKFKGAIDMEGRAEAKSSSGTAAATSSMSGPDRDKADRKPTIQGELGVKINPPSKT
jgi:cytoskeletal protein CcmA (bactofilin family)